MSVVDFLVHEKIIEYAHTIQNEHEVQNSDSDKVQQFSVCSARD